MYCWPENASDVALQWQAFRDLVSASIPDAPLSLRQSGDLHREWLSPDLLFSQTCSYPLATALNGKVRYIATQSFQVEGCQTPGYYRSAIIATGSGKSAFAPAPGQAMLPDLIEKAKFAFNTPDSMSGWHGLAADLRKTGRAAPQNTIKTGGHRMSIQAVARGEAAFAAIDCISWDMAKRFEPAAHHVHVVGWTAERPGLPFITSKLTGNAEFEVLRMAAATVFGAVVLEPQWIL
jgi:ABC-type phosphate/phosphonate transport system substrate-binding protein